jgi:hypothetical protein
MRNHQAQTLFLNDEWEGWQKTSLRDTKGLALKRKHLKLSLCAGLATPDWN